MNLVSSDEDEEECKREFRRSKRELRMLQCDKDPMAHTQTAHDEAMSFRTTMSVCPKDPDDPSYYLDVPMAPVHSIPGVSETNASTQTKFFVSQPGERFVVHAKQVNNDTNQDYGAFVYVNKGPEPAAEDYDHGFTWGPPKLPAGGAHPQFTRVHTIDGFAHTAKGSYAFIFGGSDPSASNGAASVDASDVGWIVVRFYAVTSYIKRSSARVPRPKRLKSDSGKPNAAAPAESGDRVANLNEYDRTVEPVFDNKCLCENRLRFAPWTALVTELGGVWGNQACNKSYGSLPLEALTELRKIILERVHKEIKKRSGEKGVPLPDMVRAINCRFDHRAARIICCPRDERQLLAIAKEDGIILQGSKPCLVISVEFSEMDIEAVNDEDELFGEKLQGLLGFFKDDSVSWKLEALEVMPSLQEASIGDEARRYSVNRRAIHVGVTVQEGQSSGTLTCDQVRDGNAITIRVCAPAC